MLRNYLKIALRNLRKYIGYTSINLAGLAVGIACSLLILLYVQDELSFDRFHEKADRIYRVVLDGHISGSDLQAPISPAPMAAAMVKDFPEVATATRLFGFGGQRVVRRGDRYFVEQNIIFADSTVFDVFSFPLLRGDEATALTAPYTMVLTQTTARRYFGDEDPLGQTLIMGDTTQYRITGVMADVPANSHVQFDFLASMASDGSGANNDFWISNNFYTYLVLPGGYDPATLEAKLPGFFKQYAGPQLQSTMGVSFDDFTASGNRLAYRLQPLTDIHLYSNLQYELGPNSDVAYVYIFSAVALFILLLACINFMNLATARSANRAVEVGMRKVLGSSRPQLIGQFLAESILLSLVALVLALGLMLALLPLFNELAGRTLTAAFLGDVRVVAVLIGLVLAVGVLAGSYPAFFLSAFRPLSVLKGGLAAGARSSWLRNGLVVFQFAISIALLVGTLVVYDQLSYLQSRNPGFDKEHVVVIERVNELRDQQDAFKDELRASPEVVSVAGTTALPGGLGIFGGNAYIPEGAEADEAELMSFMFVDHDFFEAMGMKMAEGRGFSRDFPADTAAFILNQAAVRGLGWTEGVGKRLGQPSGVTPDDFFWGDVVGVVEDFNYASMHQPVEAMAIRLGDFPMQYLAVRIRPGDIAGTLAFLEEAWMAFVPGRPFQYAFLDQSFDAQYRAEENLGRIFTGFALFAILIACLGLFGLASFTAEQRRKEIGVRKAMGASVPQIVVLLSKDFTRLVLLAFILGGVAAYYFMQGWLEDFAYRTSMGPGTFVLAGVIALLIAWLTVSYQSVKAALADPVKSLRYE